MNKWMNDWIIKNRQKTDMQSLNYWNRHRGKKRRWANIKPTFVSTSCEIEIKAYTLVEILYLEIYLTNIIYLVSFNINQHIISPGVINENIIFSTWKVKLALVYICWKAQRQYHI